MCERWQVFANFIEDMGTKPTDGRYTIDRIDNDGDYEPGNCRWATYSQQANNRRNNIKITRDGVTMTMAQWEKALGFKDSIVRWRKRQGMSDEECLAEPGYFLKKTHCNAGHEFNESNSYVDYKGHNICRICHRQKARRLRGLPQDVCNEPGKLSKERNYSLKTHCNLGHEFTEQNTILEKGYRKCRTCHNARQNRYSEQRRAAKAGRVTSLLIGSRSGS